jgi:hypothetical protein
MTFAQNYACWVAGAGVALFACGCAAPPESKSQLRIRQMQTRSFAVEDSQRAVKAVLDVLQDEGFIPREVDADVGYIYAVRELDIEDDRERFRAKFWQGRKEATWRKNAVVECAANVTRRPGGVRVRLSFQEKSLDNKGQVISIVTVDDPVYYQRFFTRVDKGMFIEEQGI